MKNIILILIGKSLTLLSKISNLGSGSTWPGHISLSLNPNFIRQLLGSHPKGAKPKIVIITGTNGKTTTGKLVTSIIREHNKTYLQNKAGANLINGLASAIVKGSNLNGKLAKDYFIFESDENALPQVLEQTNPDYLICLNLFRDQLDRYGEIDFIAKKWHLAFEKLRPNTTLILNADDPQIAYLSNQTKAKVLYFGLDEVRSDVLIHQYAPDSTHCPKCTYKLNFSTVFFSHLGTWECANCKLKRPKTDVSELSSYPLIGTYNKYNALAAALFAKQEKIEQKVVDIAFQGFTPAFGRQEKIIYRGKNVQIFLSKNPTSFNESLQTIKEIGGKSLLVILNDRIPDGLDVSWIWDINFEDILTKDFNIGVSGDRVYDMALRLKYAEQFTHVEPDLRLAIDRMIESLDSNETLYILPNYSAMLDVRKILTGRKIL